MSTLRDALDGVKSILLLQNDVRNLEKEVERQRDAFDGLGDDFVALDKRVVRIETMIELGAQKSQQKRIKE